MSKKNIFLYIILSFIFIYFIFGRYGVVDIIKSEVEKRNLLKKKLIIDASIIIMKHKINLIENSPCEKERIARERLGMIKEGEKIILFRGK